MIFWTQESLDQSRFFNKGIDEKWFESFSSSNIAFCFYNSSFDTISCNNM